MSAVVPEPGPPPSPGSGVDDALDVVIAKSHPPAATIDDAVDAPLDVTADRALDVATGGVEETPGELDWPSKVGKQLFVTAWMTMGYAFGIESYVLSSRSLWETLGLAVGTVVLLKGFVVPSIRLLGCWWRAEGRARLGLGHEKDRPPENG